MSVASSSSGRPSTDPTDLSTPRRIQRFPGTRTRPPVYEHEKVCTSRRAMGATGRMKLRILVAALLAAAVALIPQGANAKGVTQVRISGPDLARSITLADEGADRLAQAAALNSAFFDAGPPPPDPRLPSEDLGRRYTATYTFAVPEARTDRQATLRQELYPFAAGGGLGY